MALLAVCNILGIKTEKMHSDHTAKYESGSFDFQRGKGRFFSIQIYLGIAV